MNVHVLIRSNQKSGRVDTIMTGITSALMKMWALQNTTKTKQTLIFDRDTGKCVFLVTGKPAGVTVEKEDLGTCEDYGISFKDLQQITDERFDK